MIVEKIIKRLKASQQVIIASHINPEGDAIGCILAIAMALDKIGVKALPYNQDGVPFNNRFLPGADRVESRLPDWDPDTVVVADCGDIDRVGKVKERLAKAPTIINIDHHETNTGFGHINWVLPEMASTSEMIIELIDAMGDGYWTMEMATALYTGITADTGSFQFKNTSPNSMRQAARMIEKGAEPAKVAHHLFADLPEGNLRLLARALSTLKVENSGKVSTVEITKPMFDETGTGPENTEGFVDFPRSVRGVEVAVLFRQTAEEEYKISMRSIGNLDVARIARIYGGGGHAAAAGCTIKGTLEKVRSELLDKITSSIDK